MCACMQVENEKGRGIFTFLNEMDNAYCTQYFLRCRVNTVDSYFPFFHLMWCIFLPSYLNVFFISERKVCFPSTQSLHSKKVNVNQFIQSFFWFYFIHMAITSDHMVWSWLWGRFKMPSKLSLWINGRKMDVCWSEFLPNFGINVCESKVRPLQLVYMLIELDLLEILTLTLCVLFI